MKKYKLFSINNISLEAANAVPSSCQTLATADDLVSNNLNSLTKVTLVKGKEWNCGDHKNYDELCIVLKGEGEFYWEDEMNLYQTDDLIIIPTQGKHKLIATEDSEFYFVRILV